MSFALIIPGIPIHATSHKQQNEFVGYGSCRYLRGTKLAKVQSDYAIAAYKKLHELSQSAGRHHHTLTFELANLKRVKEVPSTAMAFSGRSDSINVMTLSTWQENTLENENIGRDGIHALAAVIEAVKVIDNEPEISKVYGNYVASTVLLC